MRDAVEDHNAAFIEGHMGKLGDFPGRGIVRHVNFRSVAFRPGRKAFSKIPQSLIVIRIGNINLNLFHKHDYSQPSGRKMDVEHTSFYLLSSLFISVPVRSVGNSAQI